MKSWAEECAKRATTSYLCARGAQEVHAAFLAAICETIEKCAEVAAANQGECTDDGCNLSWWNKKSVGAISALFWPLKRGG